MKRIASVAVGFACWAGVVHCIGDSPGSVASGTLDAGPGPSGGPVDGSSSSSGGLFDAQAPESEASAGATINGQVVDAVGLAAAGAEVVAEGSDGSTVAFVADARGAFRGKLPWRRTT